MSERKRRGGNSFAWIIILSGLGVFMVWLVFFGFAISHLESTESSKLGMLGDSFGVVNSLFSGLALVGVVVALYLQKTEIEETLELMREEQRERSAREQFELMPRFVFIHKEESRSTRPYGRLGLGEDVLYMRNDGGWAGDIQIEGDGGAEASVLDTGERMKLFFYMPHTGHRDFAVAFKNAKDQRFTQDFRLYFEGWTVSDFSKPQEPKTVSLTTKEP